MAEAMALSGRTIPQVTEWVDVDMTRAVAVVDRLRREWDDAGVRVTAMTLVAAALVRAARRFPLANAAWVDDGPALDTHAAVNLGIAADTPRGLLVPVVKDAGGLTMLEMARRIQELIDGARAGRSTPADLTGGTISLTNIGVFGIDGGTPMLPPGQSVIVAMGRIMERAWVVEGVLSVRPIMQLSITFDHRVLDGATGSRVLKSIADFLADPALEVMVEREG
jgi:pyruvate dehydrogenase E2 component (dihydrolipoamide acetyltransferase)